MFVMHYKMHALLKSIAKECIGFSCVCFASLERTATEEILLISYTCLFCSAIFLDNFVQ